MTAGGVTFSLSGVVNREHAAELQALLARDSRRRVHLNLADVTLVDLDGVTFLARMEAEGAVLLNCPEYVRSWINAEQT